MGKQTVKIVYQTVDGKWHEVVVSEAAAQREMDRLRGLPDVRTHTVRLSM